MGPTRARENTKRAERTSVDGPISSNQPYHTRSSISLLGGGGMQRLAPTWEAFAESVEQTQMGIKIVKVSHPPLICLGGSGQTMIRRGEGKQ
jgi:hypothetical protein